MKLAWHICKKDLLRLKWILLLWVVVLGAGLALTSIQAGLEAEASRPFQIAARAIMSAFVPLIAFGLVMGLLHDDPVAEIDAFWITRPIDGGSLLLAKAMGWALLGLLPVALLLPFWISHDYDWRLIGSALHRTWGGHALVAALAMPFAAVAANSSRFVLNLMVGIGGLLLLGLAARLGNTGGDRLLSPGVIESRSWVVAGIWLVTAAVVTWRQFFGRKTRQSLLLLAAAVVLGFVVAKWWPWPLGWAGAPATPVQNGAAAMDPSGAIFTVKKDGSDGHLVFAGETREAIVIAEAPLRDGAGAVRRGRMLKVQTVSVDWTGLLEASFSETNPLPWRFRDLLPGARPPAAPPEGYFVLNRGDGRSFAIRPVFAGGGLDAATLHYSHGRFSIRPSAAAWSGHPPPNLRAWLQEAVLVKVTAGNPVSGAPDVAADRRFEIP